VSWLFLVEAPLTDFDKPFCSLCVLCSSSSSIYRKVWERVDRFVLDSWIGSRTAFQANRLQSGPEIGFVQFRRDQAAANQQRLPAIGFSASLVVVAFLSLSTAAVHAQAPGSSPQTDNPTAQEPSGTNTDLFIMGGSDFDRPGLLPRANYNIGLGHTFGFLKKDPLGDELTFAYTYENSGPHGFFT
jgi:hypothetical protein